MLSEASATECLQVLLTHCILHCKPLRDDTAIARDDMGNHSLVDKKSLC